MTDFNNDSAVALRHARAALFTLSTVPEPNDVAVDAAGIVWFTAPLETAIGRLDPRPAP